MKSANTTGRSAVIRMLLLCLIVLGPSCQEQDTVTQPDTDLNPLLPVILSDSVTHTFGDRAYITAKVDPKGSEAQYWFLYGKDTTLGIASKKLGVGKDTLLIVTDTLAPLSYGTRYYYRLMVSNSKGTTAGPLRTFYSPAVDMPVIDLYRAKDITTHSVNLQVFFKARSQKGRMIIEYGETAAYGTTLFMGNFIPGQSFVVSASPYGLKHSSVYHWRFTAFTDSGTITTGDSTFATTTIAAPVEFSFPLVPGTILQYEYSLVVSGIGGQSPPGLQKKGERIVQVKSQRTENDTLIWDLECTAFDTILTRVGDNLPPDTTYDRRVMLFTIKRSSQYYHVGFDKIVEYAHGYKSAYVGPLPRIVESGTNTVTIGDVTYMNGVGLHFYQSGFIGSGGGYIERLSIKQ